VPVPVDNKTFVEEPALLLLSYSAPVILASPTTCNFSVGEAVPIPTLPLVLTTKSF
jgi:hypothetical protein